MDGSEVPLFIVYDARTEEMRCTREGAVRLLEAEIVLLADEAEDYLLCIKGRDLFAAGMRSGPKAISAYRVLKVRVDAATDDPERMMAAIQVVTEKNPTGRPPYVLPTEEDDGTG